MKDILILTDGYGILLYEERGLYRLPVVASSPSDCLFASRLPPFYLDCGQGEEEACLVGVIEKLPIPFASKTRYFLLSELNAPVVDPRSRKALALAFAFYPYLFGQKRVHPLSPDELRSSRALLKSLRKNRAGKDKIRLYRGLMRCECALPRLKEAYRLLCQC